MRPGPYLINTQPNRGETVMGNRAVITTEKKDLGIYLHWNGGRDSGTVKNLAHFPTAP